MGQISRREMLAAFLGLPAALAGCSSPPPELAGKVIGPSAELGHRLRTLGRLQSADDAWSNSKVVIIGGGIAGLSAAWRLRKAGLDDFVLLELESEPGGTSRSGTSSLVAYPWGAHYVPVPLKENRLLIGLLQEMGMVEGTDAEGEPVIAEECLCRDPQERIFYKGRWYEGLYLNDGASREDQAQLAAFHAEIDRWVAWRDGRGRRAFALPLSSGSDDPEVTTLDRLTMADWLDQHGWKSPRLRWLVDYACRDDYGTSLDHTSAWAGVFYFACRQRRPGAATQPLMTWPEGNGRLVAHFYRQVKERAQLGWAVADVVPTDPEGKRGVDVMTVNESGHVRGWHAEQVIYAAPHFLTRFLIQPYRQETPRHVAEFEYGAWLVANLLLSDRPMGRGFPLSWDNVLYESPSLGYVVATHQRCLDHGPTVFTYYHPLCDQGPKEARARLLGLDWQACADVALADLQRAHPEIRTLAERVDVMRWGHAMVRPRPGFVWGGARQAAARPYRGIHFAHADLSGVSLFEEALDHGVRAAEEVLQARDWPFSTFR